MVQTRWGALRGQRIRYLNRTWLLTGEVDVRNRGELLAVSANQTDDVRRGSATLYFGLDEPGPSLNPGNMGAHFDRLDLDGEHQYIVVKKEPREYRYELQRLRYD
jgi:hypothetical protein